MTLAWDSATGRHYSIEQASKFGTWTTLVTNLPGTGALITFTTNAQGQSRFFRLRGEL